MKLRNKKTGEIWDIGKVLVNDYPCWETLTQICEDWEDVKEPLIKDEKIRKAVRAWAEALKEDTIRFDRVSQGFSFGNGNLYSSINFDGFVIDLTDGKKYTIAELCGEEEE